MGIYAISLFLFPGFQPAEGTKEWSSTKLTHEPYEDVERVEGAEVGEVALVVAALRQEVPRVPPQLLLHSRADQVTSAEKKYYDITNDM